jgi:7,8-dihydro-6-hydroxymethylpterin-pyrophosphokinase
LGRAREDDEESSRGSQKQFNFMEDMENTTTPHDLRLLQEQEEENRGEMGRREPSPLDLDCLLVGKDNDDDVEMTPA